MDDVLKGASPEIIELQDKFLKFEFGYKKVGGMYDNVLCLMKDLSKAKRRNINDKIYRITENIVALSENYANIFSKMKTVQESSTLDKLLKDDILGMIELNMKSLTEVELSIKDFLQQLLHKRYIKKCDIVDETLLEKELLENKGNVLFISKYTQQNARESATFLKSWITRFFLSTGFIVLELIMLNCVIPNILYWGTEPVPNIIRMLLTAALTIVLYLNMFTKGMELLCILQPSCRRLLALFNINLVNGKDLINATVPVKKYRTARAREIYNATLAINNLRDTKMLQDIKTIVSDLNDNSVLSLKEAYTVILLENVYSLINLRYKEDPQSVINILNLEQSEKGLLYARIELLYLRIMKL